MISCRIEAGSLQISLSGWAMVSALRRSLRVPVAAISAVHLRSPGHKPPPWRLPGTCIPGLITAGTYRGRGRSEFWYVRGSRPAWVIELVGQDLAAVVLDVEPPTGLLQPGGPR